VAASLGAATPLWRLCTEELCHKTLQQSVASWDIKLRVISALIACARSLVHWRQMAENCNLSWHVRYSRVIWLQLLVVWGVIQRVWSFLTARAELQACQKARGWRAGVGAGGSFCAQCHRGGHACYSMPLLAWHHAPGGVAHRSSSKLVATIASFQKPVWSTALGALYHARRGMARQAMAACLYTWSKIKFTSHRRIGEHV